MKRGFTLIELLAVIVILAIIAIIAVPIVIHIINDSKKSSEKESIKLYLDTVTKTIGRQNLKLKYEPDTCKIQDSGDLICEKNNEELYVDEEKINKILKIEMKGTTPTKGTLYFTNGKIISGENILYNDLYYQLNNGIISNGTKEPVEIVLEVLSKIQGSAQNYTGICEIKNTTTMVCGNETITLSQSGHKAEEGIITFNNGEITSYTNLKMKGKYYHQNISGKKSESKTEKYGILREKNGTREFNKGDKYTYKVNDRDMFNFYILTEPEDGQVNLIMDRNICNDGTVNYTEQNNYCRYKWYLSSRNNNAYGPVTVMQELYAGTKDWNNVSDMIMNYRDENNETATDKGYTSIITSNGVTTITGKLESNTATIGTSEKPLKARLPMVSEVNRAGCTGSKGSCPVWLMENMTYWNGANDKYSMNNNTEAYQNINGYWLLSSPPGISISAQLVYYGGYVTSSGTTGGAFGARPVITVSVSDLQ